MLNESIVNHGTSIHGQWNADKYQRSLPDLPEDVFVLILQALEAWDVSNCQKVSKSWHATFRKKEYIQCVLKNYTNAIEVRNLPQAALQLDSSLSFEFDWSQIFQSVASRYYHLKQGKFRKVERYDLAPSEQIGHWYPVGQWDYHESQPGGRLYYEYAMPHLTRWSGNGSKPSLFKSSLWSYDDGLLVFAPKIPPNPARPNQILAVLEVETGKISSIPFDISSKIIRNIRLKEQTLIIEWAEKDPFHDLNDMEQVNRHFASCYDIVYSSSTKLYQVYHRSEWKMHFLGLPLNQRDRFFSTHNRTHYAVYFWQPNRSMYTGDEELPIESLFVWDITPSSTYLPSKDPANRSQPSEFLRPHIISRFPFHRLSILGIRQFANISLTSLHIDSENFTIKIRSNICVVGQGYFDPAERLWCATTTIFPFLGLGPHLRKDWDGNLPPYRGHNTMESMDLEDKEIESYYIPIMDIFDEKSKIRFSLVETCFTGQIVENKLILRIKVYDDDDDDDDDDEDKMEGEWITLSDDDLVKELTAMGRIAGDERWIIGQNERMQVVVARF